MAACVQCSPIESAQALLDMAEGLEYALSKGMTHRDFKLTNVLMSSDRVAKLVDFGLASLNSIETGTDEGGLRALKYATLEKGTGAPDNDPRRFVLSGRCRLRIAHRLAVVPGNKGSHRRTPRSDNNGGPKTVLFRRLVRRSARFGALEKRPARRWSSSWLKANRAGKTCWKTPIRRGFWSSRSSCAMSAGNWNRCWA